VSENRVLRRIFGHKSEGVMRSWRRLHNDELHHLYTSSNTISVVKSRMRWTGHVGHFWDVRLIQNFSRKPERKAPFGRQA
jgi:hypothetical protein